MPTLLYFIVIVVIVWSLIGVTVFFENVDKIDDFTERDVSSKFKKVLCWTLFVFACGPLAIFLFLCFVTIGGVLTCVVLPLCDAFENHVIENIKTWLTK